MRSPAVQGSTVGTLKSLWIYTRSSHLFTRHAPRVLTYALADALVCFFRRRVPEHGDSLYGLRSLRLSAQWPAHNPQCLLNE